MPRSALLAALLVVLATAATAQEPPRDPHAVQPERPTIATHAYTVAPGWLEIEAGLELDRYADRSRGGSAPVVIKLGLAPGLQFDLDGAILKPGRARTVGLGDLAIALKWRLAEKAPVVGDFTVLSSLKVPSAPTSSGLGTGTTDVGFLLISSHQIGHLSLDVNVGYTRRSGPDSLAPRNATLWTVSFGGPAVGEFGWAAEVYGYPATSGPAGAASVVAVLGGPTLPLRRWLALDAGVIVPLTGPQPWALYLGGVYNAGRLWSAPPFRKE